MTRRIRFQLAVFFVAALLPAAAVAGPASLAAAGPTQLSGSVGHVYDKELRVQLLDEQGWALPDVVVTFVAPGSGPSASLSPAPALTDEDGVASVTATANSTVGTYTVTASVAGLPQTVAFTLLNVPQGFRPGEQLASVFGADEKGKIRNLRDFLDGGTSYALIEICTYCPACLDSERAAPIGIAWLKERKISVNFAPVIIQGGDAIAGATEAQIWKSTIGLKGPVLHVSGSQTSEMYQAAANIIGLPFNIPWSLLVAPDGTIVDRFYAAMTPQSLEDRVLRILLPEHPVTTATGADVKVALGQQSLVGTAAPTLTGPLGSATFTSYIYHLLDERINFRFDGASPLPDAVRLEITPLWSDGARRLSDQPVVFANYFSVFDGSPIELRFSQIESPVSTRNGTFIVDVDVKAARSELAANLVPYVNDGTITQEQANGLVQNLYGVWFEDMPVTIDLRLTGNAR